MIVVSDRAVDQWPRSRAFPLQPDGNVVMGELYYKDRWIRTNGFHFPLSVLDITDRRIVSGLLSDGVGVSGGVIGILRIFARNELDQ